MNKKWLITATASLILSLCLVMTATASPLLQEIRAYLNKEVKLTLNGAPWQAQSGGQVMYPITYNGSTYLPVRAVAEALDIPIQWDAATKTVHIGGTSELIPILSEPYRPISATITDDEQERKIQGNDYGKVVWFSKILHSPSQFIIEPLGQYGQVVLKIGIEGADTRIILENAIEGSVIKSVLLTESDGVVDIKADITGVQQIRIKVHAEEPNTSSSVRIVANQSYYTTN